MPSIQMHACGYPALSAVLRMPSGAVPKLVSYGPSELPKWRTVTVIMIVVNVLLENFYLHRS